MLLLAIRILLKRQIYETLNLLLTRLGLIQAIIINKNFVDGVSNLAKEI